MATKAKAGKKDPTSARVRTQANRERKLKRLIKEQPNNLQLPLALKAGRTPRKTPGKQVWSHSDKRLAQVVKVFKGLFHMDMLAKDPKVQQTAFAKVSVAITGFELLPNKDSSMFSLGTRAMNPARPQWTA